MPSFVGIRTFCAGVLILGAACAAGMGQKAANRAAGQSRSGPIDDAQVVTLLGNVHPQAREEFAQAAGLGGGEAVEEILRGLGGAEFFALALEEHRQATADLILWANVERAAGARETELTFGERDFHVGKDGGEVGVCQIECGG